jgi:diadenosine tetraphosphate (Ap4A) HIT family hydrolase
LTTLKSQRPGWSANWNRIKDLSWNAGHANPTPLKRGFPPVPQFSKENIGWCEHAYPVKTIGWLVIVLKRHAEALHELTVEEFAELAQIQAKLTKALFDELRCEKEYISCYAKTEHFYHIHFHVCAKPPDLPGELKGGKSFALLKVTNEEAVPPNQMIAFCELLRDRFAQAV